MKTCIRKTVGVLVCGAMCFVVTGQALAGDFMKCERRNDPQRSRVSVETEDLVPGALYTATIQSGNNSAMSTVAANRVGQVEYDFDSNRRDILAGATEIASNFIAGGKVAATVTDALGTTVASGSSRCRVR